MPSRAVQHQGLAFDEKAVFLNFPYDASYERVFLALLAVLLSLGRKPRCTFEIADVGQGRVSRIFDRLESSAVSIHDLSRVGSPARFNMPWELGLADAMRRYWGQHRELKRKHRRKNVFHAAIYRQLVVIGTEKAAELSH
jgi:hypothetical protein